MNEADLTGVQWRKASYSNTQGGNCVEVADLGTQVVVRDSKDPDGPTLTFTRAEWEAFIAGAKDGEFDR